MTGDVYNGVGEMLMDIITNDVAKLSSPGTFYNIQPASYYNGFTFANLNADSTYASQIDFMSGIINIRKSSQVVTTDLVFNSTWMLETYYQDSRAQLINLGWIYGDWELSRLTLTNLNGMNNPYFKSEVGTFSIPA